MTAGTTYPLFRCKGRGLTMHADRKASVALGVAVAVAAKSLLGRGPFSQSQEGLRISGRMALVSGLLRLSDAPESINGMAVPTPVRGRGRPTGFRRGQLMEEPFRKQAIFYMLGRFEGATARAYSWCSIPELIICKQK